MAILCTSTVLSSICRAGELWVWICGRYGCWTAGHCALHQCTAEWGREHACYGKSQSTSCRLSVEEMPHNGENHWRACCAAAGLYAILHKVQPSSLHHCTHQACATVAPACLRCGHIYIYHMHLNFRGTKLSEIADLHNICKFHFHGWGVVHILYCIYTL